MKLRVHRRVSVLPLVLSLLLLAACDEDSRAVAVALRDTGQAVAVFQATIIESEKQKAISVDTARTLMEFAQQLNRASKDAIVVARAVNELKIPDRVKLLSILAPIIDQVAVGQSFVLGNVVDLKTRNTILATLKIMQTSLNTAQLILAASKGGV
jgi:hypothetical protein